jgi:hypothetical protein
MTMFSLRRLLACLILVVAIVLGRSSAAQAQVIAGRVVDAATGGGVGRARITAWGDGGTRSTFTGADGRYTIEVRGGTYHVRATRTGYQTATSAEMAVAAGDTSRVVLRMTPEPRQLTGVHASTRPRRLPMSGRFTPEYPTDSLLAAERTHVEGVPGRLIIHGVMLTPTPCWRLAGAADRVGPLITLNIQAHLGDEFCPPDAPGASTYKVSLRGIPPGTYTVRVLHTYRRDAFKASVALDSAGVTVR